MECNRSQGGQSFWVKSARKACATEIQRVGTLNNISRAEVYKIVMAPGASVQEIAEEESEYKEDVEEEDRHPITRHATRTAPNVCRSSIDTSRKGEASSRNPGRVPLLLTGIGFLSSLISFSACFPYSLSCLFAPHPPSHILSSWHRRRPTVAYVTWPPWLLLYPFRANSLHYGPFHSGRKERQQEAEGHKDARKCIAGGA
jgi:hypothetical protein